MARKPKEAITPDTDISNFSPEVQKRLREELDKYLSDKLAMETKPASQDDNIISVDENNSDNLLKKVSIEKEIEQHPKTIEESLEKEIAELSASPSVYAQGRSNGIKYMIKWMKEHNIYNQKDFHYLK